MGIPRLGRLPAASTAPVVAVEAGEIGFDFAPETQFGAVWGVWGVWGVL